MSAEESTTRLITHARQLDLAPEQRPPRPAERRVLMADPAHFAVEYVINPHMAAHVGGVDQPLARRQWSALRDAYVALGFTVDVLPAAPGLPDLVFIANQSFPVLWPDGRWGAVLSRMHHAQRQPEVALVAAWYAAAGGACVPLDVDGSSFEGTGDALWWPGRRLVVGGHGFRTDAAVYARLAELVAAPVVALRLVDERFYHLDTCLSLLDERTALYVPEAFDAEGLALLEALVPRLVPVPIDDAAERLACNGHCPDGRHVLLQSGCPQTVASLRELGFTPIELDTSEYLKSGGSVFCMKLMLP